MHEPARSTYLWSKAVVLTALLSTGDTIVNTVNEWKFLVAAVLSFHNWDSPEAPTSEAEVTTVQCVTVILSDVFFCSPQETSAAHNCLFFISCEINQILISLSVSPEPSSGDMGSNSRDQSERNDLKLKKKKGNLVCQVFVKCRIFFLMSTWWEVSDSHCPTERWRFGACLSQTVTCSWSRVWQF